LSSIAPHALEPILSHNSPKVTGAMPFPRWRLEAWGLLDGFPFDEPPGTKEPLVPPLQHEKMGPPPPPNRPPNPGSRLKSSYEFHFEGLSIFSLLVERLVQIQEYRNEMQNSY
jgi:hypothetical protein